MNKRPKITELVFLKILALAVLEPVLDQNFYYMGTKLTNAGFAACLCNILPAVTFVMALLLRMEKLNITQRHSQAKVVGTAWTVAGALLMILYKGPVVEFAWPKGRGHRLVGTASGGGGSSNWLKRTAMLLSNVLESYRAELSLTALICATGASLSAAVAPVMERGSARRWAIGWDIRHFTAVYSGVVCSGVSYSVHGKVSKERGPVFVLPTDC